MSELRSNYIDVTLGNSRVLCVRGIYQYDYGLIMRLYGIPSGVTWQIHFGYQGMPESIMALTETVDDVVEVQIPDSMLLQPRDISCYVYWESEEYGVTEYEIHLPILRRIKPMTISLSPEEAQTFSALIERANSLVASADATDAQSEQVNQALQAALDALEGSSFYLDVTDGNLYYGVGNNA